MYTPNTSNNSGKELSDAEARADKKASKKAAKHAAKDQATRDRQLGARRRK